MKAKILWTLVLWSAGLAPLFWWNDRPFTNLLVSLFFYLVTLPIWIPTLIRREPREARVLARGTALVNLALVIWALTALPEALERQRSFERAGAKTPVLVGGDAALDTCLSLAVPILADPADRLPVRSGPGSRFPVIDHLSLGDRFFVCNPSGDQAWMGIVYPDRHAGMAEGECGVSSPLPGDTPYTGPCRSGWIPADAFEVERSRNG